MMKATTLTEVLEANRAFPRSITYLEGENESRSVPAGELYERALGILHHLQRIGARRGDKLILFLGNNEQFIDVFWAAILGGLVPVPVALGISDEHRHKLLRIARRLGSPFLYTERRSLERIGALPDRARTAERGELRDAERWSRAERRRCDHGGVIMSGPGSSYRIRSAAPARVRTGVAGEAWRQSSTLNSTRWSIRLRLPVTPRRLLPISGAPMR